jgi:NADP-dependent 3-hydroxy acid dehydrogenase YdfG
MSNIVLVTGASSGMGRATVELLAKKDFIVYAATRDIKTFKDLSDSNIIPVELDLTKHR